MIKLKDLITEAKELPKVGDNIDIVTSSYYVQKIKKVSGDYVVVDNRKGKKAPAVILGKKKDKLGLYNASFKIKINNLKKSKYQHQSTIGHTNWILKSTKGAIDGKDLEFDQMGRGKLFGFVNEAKLTESIPSPIPTGKKFTNAQLKTLRNKYKEFPNTKWFSKAVDKHLAKLNKKQLVQLAAAKISIITKLALDRVQRGDYIKEVKLNEGAPEQILKQISKRTMRYIGANTFVKGRTGEGEYIQFNVKGRRLKKGGRIQVIYSKGNDNYVVKAWQIRGSSAKLVKQKSDIHIEVLDDVIEDLVG